jgi:putative ABC transport system permease protein
MGSLLQDLRYGVRMLAKAPGFTIVAVSTLALGIGATTAIFSVIDATLLARLPYGQSDRLVMVWESNPTRGLDRNVVSPGNFLHWQEENTVFDDLAGFYDLRLNLTGSGEPEQIPVQAVTPNLFSLLGVNANIGRTFISEEGRPGKDNVVLLSYGLWQRKFGGDPDIPGKTMTLDGKTQTIVGVMPRGFELFVQQHSRTGEHAGLWLPLAFRPEDHTPVGRYMMAVGRLKAGVSLALAQTQMNVVAKDLERQFPAMDTGWRTSLVPLHDQFVAAIREPLTILFGAVGFVLLIACANVANLLLGRAAERKRELAIRTALGASPPRVVRQFLTESILLAFIGSGFGILLAFWGMQLLLTLAPEDLLDIRNVHIDFRILLFTLAVTIVTGLMFGLVPALGSAKINPGELLKEGERIVGIGVRGSRLRNVFVVAEIGLAVVLLAGAGLLIKSFLRLESVSPGFDPQNILMVKVELPDSKYKQDAQIVQFFNQVLEKVRALPGVESASANSAPPFTGPGAGTDFKIEGRPAPPLGEAPGAEVRVVAHDYFRTMHIPLVRGRQFTAREESEARHVVIVSQKLVQQYFANEDPIGKKITIDMKDQNVPSEIVGVVGDTKHYGLDSEVLPTAYWPHPELAYSGMTLMVRSKSNPTELAGSIRDAVRSLDADQPASNARTMEDWMAGSVAQTRFNTFLLTIFSGIALALAIIGIYGVVSVSVAQRTHEIGIRMALGALPRDVQSQVLGVGVKTAAAGLATGLAAAFALTRLLRSMLFEVQPADPAIFAAVSALLVVVTLAACYIPARRATRVDPLVALRHE